MAAKVVQVSDDNGATWFTLPGGSGSLNQEAGQINDTIFGQSFESNEAGVITWRMEANAIFKGYAGYVADLWKQGTSTVMTAEPMSLVSGKTYKTTNVVKNLWDRSVTVTVLDGAVDHTADVLSVNYLFGEVTFKAAYTPAGAITVTGKYFPKAVLGCVRGFTLTQSANPIVTSCYDVVQANGGYHTHDPGLRTVGLQVDGVYRLATGAAAALAAHSEWMIEINPDGNELSVARGFFRLTSDAQSGDVGALETERLQFALNVPASPTLLQYPFRWQYDPATTISTAVRKILDAWQNETKLDARYMPDGLAGNKGDVIVSECSLSSTLEGMNEFSVTLMGDGGLTVAP